MRSGSGRRTGVNRHTVSGQFPNVTITITISLDDTLHKIVSIIRHFIAHHVSYLPV